MRASRPLPEASTFRDAGRASSSRRTLADRASTNRVSRLGEPRLFKLGCSGLPRKEVIQPHLPVRLPCYDFTPIASPTFDGSLPCGLGHRLRVLPTFVV